MNANRLESDSSRQRVSSMPMTHQIDSRPANWVTPTKVTVSPMASPTKLTPSKNVTGVISHTTLPHPPLTASPLPHSVGPASPHLGQLSGVRPGLQFNTPNAQRLRPLHRPRLQPVRVTKPPFQLESIPRLPATPSSSSVTSCPTTVSLASLTAIGTNSPSLKKAFKPPTRKSN